MSDRHAPLQGRTDMPPRNGADSFPLGRHQTSAPTSNNLRRNLFHGHLTRKPASGAGTLPSAMATSNLAQVAADSDARLGSGSRRSGQDDSGEIIARDANGEIQMTDPPSPTPDELKDMALDERQEEERERQRLAETIKYHQQRSSIPGQPEELLEAIRASMRVKVAALADDNWMYESEDIPRTE